MSAARLVVMGYDTPEPSPVCGWVFGRGSFRFTVDGGNLEAVTACIARALRISGGDILDAWLEPPEGFDCPPLGFKGGTFPAAADVVAKARACTPRDPFTIVTVTA